MGEKESMLGIFLNPPLALALISVQSPDSESEGEVNSIRITAGLLLPESCLESLTRAQS